MKPLAEIPLSEAEMFDQIMHEVRYIRARLDAHVDEEDKDLSDIRKEVFKIREEMAAHRTKIGTITSAIAAGIAVVVSWISYQIQK